MKRWLRSVGVMLMVVSLVFTSQVTSVSATEEYESVIHYYGSGGDLPVLDESTATTVTYDTYETPNPFEKYNKTLPSGITYFDLDWLKDDLIVKAYKDSYGKKPLLPVKDRKKWTYVSKVGQDLINFQKKYPNQKAVQAKFSKYSLLLYARQEVWKALSANDRVNAYEYMTDLQLMNDYRNLTTDQAYQVWTRLDENTKAYFNDEIIPSIYGTNGIDQLMGISTLTVEQRVGLINDSVMYNSSKDIAVMFLDWHVAAEDKAEMIEYMRYHGQDELVTEIVNKMGNSELYDINDYLLTNYGYYVKTTWETDYMYEIPSNLFNYIPS